MKNIAQATRAISREMIASEKGKNMPALWISAYIHMQLGTGFVLLRMLPENALYWPRRTGGGKSNGIGGFRILQDLREGSSNTGLGHCFRIDK